MRCLHGYGTQSKRKPAPAQNACRQSMEAHAPMEGEMLACKPMKRHVPAQAYVTGAGRRCAAAAYWTRREASAPAAIGVWGAEASFMQTQTRSPNASPHHIRRTFEVNL